MIPVRRPIVRSEALAQPAKQAEQKPPPYRNEWKEGDVSCRELIGYLPDNTAAGSKFNYFNYIESRWPEGLWVRTTAVSGAQEHYRTGILQTSHPSTEDGIRGYCLSVTLAGEREPFAQFYIASADRDTARSIHLGFLTRYNTILENSRLMRLQIDLVSDYKKEKAVDEALTWIQDQYRTRRNPANRELPMVNRFNNRARVSLNTSGSALAKKTFFAALRYAKWSLDDAVERSRYMQG